MSQDRDPWTSSGQALGHPRLLVVSGEVMEAFAHVPEGAAVMIRRFPDGALVLGDGRSVSRSQVIQTVILGIDGVIPDERPLLKESLKVDGVLLAVALVHQQQSVQ